MNNTIIDSHSHIGKDNTWELIGTLKEYLQKAQEIGITESLLMPTPMPIIKIANYEITPIMLGIYDEEYFIVQRIKNKREEKGILVNNNPYQYVNELLYQQIKSNSNKSIKLHFIPLIHPLFDTKDYLEHIINKYNPIAFKIHGYSSILSPKEITNDFWELIEYYNIPCIIHTDCDTSKDEESIDTIYRNENSPLNWLSILEKHSIKAYLTHGARLSMESANIINNNPNYVIGLGPDSILSKTKDRMYLKDNYLETIFTLFDINKICFDIDYPWNTISYDNQKLDWNSLTRINQLNISNEDKEKVLSKNSKNFFNI